MRIKILSKRISLAITLIGFSIFLLFIFSVVYENSINSTKARPVLLNRQENENSGFPVRLNIPKLNIDARIEHVGLTPEQAMDVPKNIKNVAWFELGSRPGEEGVSVIAGHYGWKGGEASAFDSLYKLRKGDKLYVVDEKGATTTFVVRESRRYDSKADAGEVFGSLDGKAHLNLITCEGTLDKNKKGYTERRVVFTDKEESLE